MTGAVVAVTGARGFLGCNVVETLLRHGRTVLALDRRPHWPPEAREAFAALPGRLLDATADVRDARALERALGQAGGALAGLVHAAAITAGPEREARDASLVAEVNLVGTLRALEAARAAGAARVVVLSSASVYGVAGYPADGVLVEGRDVPQPTSLYGIGKLAAERAALRCGERWGLDVVALRVGGAFGPWEHDSGARDTLSGPMQLTRARLRGERVQVDPGGHHDWVYALDVADTVHATLDAATLPARLLHVSGGGRWTLADWYHALERSLDARVGIDRGGPTRRFEAVEPARATLDVTLARSLHAPRFGLAEAVDDYLTWLARRGAAWHTAW